MRTLIIAETLVDVVSETPFPGGTGANVAIHATRLGGAAILASGVSADEWGRWLRTWLEAECIDLTYFVELTSGSTPISEVSIDRHGEPAITMRAGAITEILEALAPRLGRAVDSADALFFASNTLADPCSREITVQARDLALSQGKPVLVDFNFRPNQWSDPDEAARQFLAAAAGASLFKCNQSEAAIVTGKSNVGDAATAIANAGFPHVVVTLGASGALLAEHGGTSVRMGAPQAATISTLGAGDALMGGLLGTLRMPAFDTTALRTSLQQAMTVAARSTEYLGAVAPQPDSQYAPWGPLEET